jgi:glycosyltransferase involved in cell wall biosynthesis
MSQPRILHVLSSSGFHGAEAMVVELCKASAALGLECHLLSFDNRGRGNFEAARRLEGVCASTAITRANHQYDPVAVASMRAIIARAGISVVHSHSYKATLHALLARRRQDTAIVTTHHNWIDENLKDRIYGIIDRQMARRVDVAVGVSEKVVSRLRAKIPAARLRLIGNGIDTERFGPTADRTAARRALSLPEGWTAGFVGRLTPKKGVQDLLAATAQLSRGERPQLLVVGDGDVREDLQARARELGVSANATFAGSQADIAAWYAAMDVLVLPSYEEGFPMVILEALACGVPVIATRVGDIPRLVEPGNTGWLIDAGDVAGLTAALREAQSAVSRLTPMGASGRALVVDKFSSEHMARQYLDAYRQAIEIRRQQRS